MPYATMTSKGQVTVPKEVRELLKLRAGRRLEFRIEADGSVRLIPSISIRELAGILHRPGMKPISVEDMNRAISEAVAEKVSRSLPRKHRA